MAVKAKPVGSSYLENSVRLSVQPLFVDEVAGQRIHGEVVELPPKVGVKAVIHQAVVSGVFVCGAQP